MQGFRQLLHRLLKTVDKAYGAAFPNAENAGNSTQQQSGAAAAFESTTVQMDVADTDDWSVEKTAGRLKDFALSLYQGGPRQAHLEKMTKAMEEGYRQAAEAFGGKLPEIARRTLDAARALLADWAKGGRGHENPAS